MVFGMTMIVTRAPWAELASTAPSLPGGSGGQVSSLREVLRAFAGETDSKLVSDRLRADKILKQIGVLGLTKRNGDQVELTEVGAAWLRDPNGEDLVLLLHARIAYFGEMLARVAKAPVTVEELHRDATGEYLMAWASYDQVRRRLAWLHDLDLVEDGPKRQHRITEKGLTALGALVLQDPKQLQELLAESGTDVTPPPAPPILAGALANVEAESRSLAWSYLTKDPLAALTMLAEKAKEATTKEDAVSAVASGFDIAQTSARSFVDAAGALGLYEYVSKFEICATPLGREWVAHASAVNLVRLLHLRFLGVGELLLFLDEQPRTVGEIHNRMFAHASSAPRQDRTAGVLRYLARAGAVTTIGYARYTISGLGRALIRELPIAEASQAPSDLEPPDHSQTSNEAPVRLLVTELEAASRDSMNPQRFEKACAEAFVRLGVEAEHLGGPGRTDVLVTIRSNLNVVVRAIVDAKSSAGQLNEGSVKFDALREHAEKHDATLMAVIAPSFDGSGRLVDWATANGVALYTAADLGRLITLHETSYPFSAEDVADLLSIERREDVSTRHGQSLEYLALISSVMQELLTEAKQAQPEPIAARDIGRVMRRSGSTVTDDEVAAVLRFLEQPEVAAVSAVTAGKYTLPSAPHIAAGRLQAIARAIGGGSA